MSRASGATEKLLRENRLLRERVAELERAEAGLRQARDKAEQDCRRLQAVFDAALDAIVIADDRARYVEVNPAACALFGYSRDEFLRLSIWDIVPDGQGEGARALWDALLAQGTLSGEFTIRRQDGSTRHIEFRSVANVIPGLHASVNRDVTDRKRAAEALRESESRFQSFMENSPAVAWMKDEQLRFAYVNRTWERRFRRSLDEIRGLTDLDVRPPEVGEELRRHDRAVLSAGHAMEFEEIVPDPDGRPHHWQVYKFPFRDAGGNRYVGGMAVDVSERQEAEKTLRAYAERLEVLSRRLLDTQESERRHVARELHDEIGQALTALKLTLDVPAAGLPDAVGRSLASARLLVEDLTGRVRDLSLRLRPSMLDDFGLVPALLWHFERYTAHTGVQVAFRHGGLGQRRLPAGAETAAYRIVQEALTNVARHAGVKEVSVELCADPGTLYLKVEDRGCGFRPDDHVDGSSGVNGMRERAGLLGGRLEIDSVPGTGTSLFAELPVAGAAGEDGETPDRKPV